MGPKRQLHMVGIDRGNVARSSKIQREPVSVSELTLALQCGGSDAYSGMTANPALGAAATLLVRNGGTASIG